MMLHSSVIEFSK